MRNMKTITVKLPEPLASWLTHRAQELGRPQSEVVREALANSRRGSGFVSCHDLMADVCGSVPAPFELSTNPKYMDDFGLGSRMAARFAQVGLREDLPELRGRTPRRIGSRAKSR